MWRLRQTASLAKWSRFCSHLRSFETRNAASNRQSSFYGKQIPFDRYRVLGRQMLARDMVTRAKRATGADSSSEEFSESDELEKEQELEELEDVAAEGEDANIGMSDDETAGEAEAKLAKEKGPSRTFGRADAPLSAKAQELWGKVSALPRGEKVVPLLESWKEEGNELEQATLAGIVGRLQRITRYGLALEIIEWMLEQDEYKDSSAVRGSFVECTARHRGASAAMKYFEGLSAEEKTRPVYDAMLVRLVSKAQVKKAEAVFQEMEKAGFVSGSPFAINLMLRLYKQKGNTAKFQEMLEKAKEAFVQPNIQTYNVMLELKCKEGDITGMEKVLEEIKENPDTSPDSITFATMTRAYLKAGMRDKAEVSMLRLENGAFRKTKKTWECLMDFYAELGNQEEVERMWSKCRAIQGDGATSYLLYMNALGKLGAVDKVEKMFHKVDNWKPSKNTEERRYNSLLMAYQVAGESEKAQELEKKMAEAGVAKTVKMGAVTGGAKEVRPKVKKAEEFAKRLDGLVEKGNLKGAEFLFDECRRAKLTDVDMWNRLLKAYVKAEMPAYGFLLRMAADKVSPNDKTKQLLEKMPTA